VGSKPYTGFGYRLYLLISKKWSALADDSRALLVQGNLEIEGLETGVSLGGATVEPDNDANYRLYGKTLTATDIVRGTEVKPSTEGKSLVTVLSSKITKHSN
jgi:lipid-binding SYLF domain-containing protein